MLGFRRGRGDLRDRAARQGGTRLRLGAVPWSVIPAAALVVAGLAIAYAKISGEPFEVVLFSGQGRDGLHRA